MAGLMRQYRGDVLLSRGDPFRTLVRSVIGQQISVKAADAVWGRVAEHLGDVSPAGVLAAEETGLRRCGLSLRKVEYLTELALRFEQGAISPRRWARLEDGAIIAELTATRGIGRWTAEMLLIFNLLRPDVFPVADKGLQKAVSLRYLGGEALSLRELTVFGERWRPWRSVATWYLWRSLDPLPVEY
jgi:DNA-3-methyladenine glycosylase II